MAYTSLIALAAATAPQERVVENGREEVERGDEGAVGGDPIHRGVVPGGGVHQHARVVHQREVAQHLGQLRAPQLARAAGAMRKRGEPDGAGAETGCAMMPRWGGCR